MKYKILSKQASETYLQGYLAKILKNADIEYTDDEGSTNEDSEEMTHEQVEQQEEQIFNL